MSKKENLTFQEAEAISKKCDNFSEFRTKYAYIYRLVREKGWLDKLYPNRKKQRYWTLERIKSVATNYKNFTDFNKNEQSLSNIARDKGWLDELFPIRRRIRSDDEILAIMAKYQYQKDLRKYDKGAYIAAFRRGFLNTYTYKEVPKKVKWTYEKVKEVAESFLSYTEFAKNNEYLDNLCRKKGWLDEFFPDRRKILSDKELIEIAKQFSNLKEFREEAPNAYSTICGRGILIEATSHMNRIHDWHKSLDKAKDLAANYTKLKDFRADHDDWYTWLLRQEDGGKVIEHLERSNPEPYTLQRVKEIARNS